MQAVQPVVTVFVEHLAGDRADLATLSGLAFSITGAADLIASPFLGRRSDTLGYRRVLLISLAGAALASAPQFFVSSYWAFVAARFGLGLFVGGILPTANALVGRLAPASDRGAVYGATASAMFLGQSLGPLSGGRGDRGRGGGAMGVPGDGRVADGQSGVGVVEGAGGEAGVSLFVRLLVRLLNGMAAVAGVIVVGLVAAALLIDPNDYKARIVDAVQGRDGADADAGGAS